MVTTTITKTQSSLLESVTNQIMMLISDLLIPLRNKSMVQNVRLRPTIIMSDKTIQTFLSKRLIIDTKDPENPIVYFQGQYRYSPELWETDTLDKQRKIARYIIEQNTVR